MAPVVSAHRRRPFFVAKAQVGRSFTQIFLRAYKTIGRLPLGYCRPLRVTFPTCEPQRNGGAAMNRANVGQIGERELAALNESSEKLIELDAEAWEAACDEEAVDYTALCRSHWRRSSPVDT